MPTLILTDSPTDPRSVLRAMGMPDDSRLQSWDRGAPSTVWPNTPYLMCRGKINPDRQFLSTFADPATAKTLADLSLAFGGDNTLALAELTKQLRDAGPYGMAGAGAAASTYSGRMERLADVIKAYQNDMLAYRRAMRSDAASHVKAAARQQMVERNAYLNRRFRSEVRTMRTQMSARYRTLLSKDERLPEMVRHTRKVAKLDVASRVEATNLMRFARGARYLGNGVAAIDFGSRASDIYDEYKDGGDWGRKMFVESTTFVATTATGSRLAFVGTAVLEVALDVALAATPANGWPLLIITLFALSNLWMVRKRLLATTGAVRPQLAI